MSHSNVSRRDRAPGWAVLVALSIALGCSAPQVDRRAELDELLALGQHVELLARVAVYRENDERGPSLDYGEGLALLAQNNDKVAAKRLSNAVRADSTLTGPIAEAYRLAAVADHKEAWYDRAMYRMREAYRYNPEVELEPCADSVADLLFRFEKDYHGAYSIYRRLIHKKGPHQNKVKEWVFRYGYCLEKLGFRDDALDQYRGYRVRWPEDIVFMRHVMARLMTLLLDDAEAAMGQGELDLAMSYIDEALADWNIELMQRGRYLAGQIEERRQDPQAALDWYSLVLKDEKHGGEVVQFARERARALRDQGVH